MNTILSIPQDDVIGMLWLMMTWSLLRLPACQPEGAFFSDQSDPSLIYDSRLPSPLRLRAQPIINTPSNAPRLSKISTSSNDGCLPGVKD